MTPLLHSSLPQAPQPTQALFEAIKSGDLALVRAALDQGADPHERRDCIGPFFVANALTWAIGQESNLDIVDLLLERGCEVTHGNLLDAAARKQVDIFLKLAPHAPEASFQGADWRGDPLASFLARDDVCAPALEEALLRGAHPNGRNHQGLTPLMVACCLGAPACARVLVRHGADINARDGGGCTALALACLSRLRTPCATFLLSLPGIEVDVPSARGVTPVMWAASHSRELVELLAPFSEIDRRAHQGQSAAMMAAKAGDVACLAFLLDGHGLDVHDVRHDGRDCAMLAAAEGRLQALAFLASRGADLGRLDVKGLSCLELARQGESADRGERDQCVAFIEAWRQAQMLDAHAPPGSERPTSRL